MPTTTRNTGGLLPRLCLGLAVLAVAGGCGQPATETPEAAATPAATAAAGLEIRDPQASLTPGGTGAVYLTVANPGPEGDRLLRVETGAARAAETHESLEDGGVVRMVARPEGFEVPAGGTLELAPGGKHIMLIDPQAPQDGAGAIPLTLHFERAGAIEVQAALSAAGGDGMDHSGHDMDHSGHDMDHSGHDMDHSDHAAEPGKGN